MSSDSHTNMEIKAKLIQELRPRKFSRVGRLWVGFLVLIILIGSYNYFFQLKDGLSITAMRDYTTWGIYISSFVFFVAISLVGSLISAILKLSNVRWRTPLTRLSEIIAVASIIMAAVIIVVDMGRPDRFLNVLIHPRLQSPIIWDVLVIGTYLVISLLLLYLPLIPDIALLRDEKLAHSKWQAKLYRILSLNWNDTMGQKRILNRSIRILSITIIPVAFTIHTVTSWLFATTLRPGWDSTNFGPYFVSGAFMVGAGAVIAAMYLLRKSYNLDAFFNDRLFDRMGRLLVLLSLVYLYFNVNEYFVPSYKMKGTEAEHINELFVGEYAPMFWLVQIGGMIIPIIVLLFRRGRKPFPMFIVSVLVILGAWFKRFLIVVPTLGHAFIPMDRVPEDWIHYSPSFQEWSITGASLACALLIITFLIRHLPIIPIAETLEEYDWKQPLRSNTE